MGNIIILDGKEVQFKHDESILDAARRFYEVMGFTAY
jgi:hypothetical protein